MSANEPLPPDHSRKLGITCGAGFANTIRYPKRRRGLKYVKRIAIQTTQTVMLVITATFRFIRFRKINAPRIVPYTTTFASPSFHVWPSPDFTCPGCIQAAKKNKTCFPNGYLATRRAPEKYYAKHAAAPNTICPYYSVITQIWHRQPAAGWSDVDQESSLLRR